MLDNRLTTVGVVVSMVFGLAVALLAITSSPALGTVAAVGGILVGAFWVVVGMTGAARRGRGGSPSEEG